MMSSPLHRPRALASAAAAVACLLPAALAAQDAGGRLFGTVVDAEGRPVPDAEVQVVGTTHVARTGAAGAFRVEGIAPGGHLVRVRRLGYAPATWSLTLARGAAREAQVVLDPLPTQLSPVQVTARSGYGRGDADRMRDFTRRRAMGFGRFLTRDDIERTRGGNTTLAQVLSQAWPARFALEGPGAVSDARHAELFREGSLPELPAARSRCTQAVVSVNGLPVAPGFTPRDILTDRVEAVEAYQDRNLPIQFQQPGRTGCLVVVWMRTADVEELDVAER